MPSRKDGRLETELFEPVEVFCPARTRRVVERKGEGRVRTRLGIWLFRWDSNLPRSVNSPLDSE